MWRGAVRLSGAVGFVALRSEEGDEGLRVALLSSLLSRLDVTNSSHRQMLPSTVQLIATVPYMLQYVAKPVQQLHSPMNFPELC